MNTLKDTGQLADEIRQLYRSNPSRADALIEVHLRRNLKDFSSKDRWVLFEDLLNQFTDEPSHARERLDDEEAVLSRISLLLLGKDVSHADVTSEELLKRLAESLNTVFDTLNQLIKVINMTLFSSDHEDRTIRFMIGSHVEGRDRAQSLESHLGQIQKAFLITQQAVKNAAQTKVEEILDELDPERISASGSGGIKFGPLRKAECFERYERKFQTFRKWFESGRFLDAFLREFEKNCRKLSEE